MALLQALSIDPVFCEILEVFSFEHLESRKTGNKAISILNMLDLAFSKLISFSLTILPLFL